MMKRSTRERAENLGFARVAAATPVLKVGNPLFNAQASIELMKEAEGRRVAALFFPELGLTAYTCADLFHQRKLLDGAIDALEAIRAETSRTSEGAYSGIVFVGLPLMHDGVLFNCAVGICRGKVLGVVPKTYLVNNGEFYEWRWFSPADAAKSKTIAINGVTEEPVPFGRYLLFACEDMDNLTIGLDICEDGWALDPPSTLHAMHGATVIGNMSASPEMVGKADYRRTLFTMRSATCIAAYVYASAGVHESTQDLVFGGHQFVAENGSLLRENKRFGRQSSMTVVDCDLDRLVADRLRIKNFSDSRRQLAAAPDYRYVSFALGHRPAPTTLERKVLAHPFVPGNSHALAERCEEIFSIQVAGLARRLEQIWRLHEPDCPTRSNTGASEYCACNRLRKDGSVHIGVSGGRDSTLALLTACRAMDMLGLPRTCIHGTTMPGFGTTDGTKKDAVALMKQLGITEDQEQDIRFSCLEEWRRTGHKPFGRIDVAGIYARAEHELGGKSSFSDFESKVLTLFEEELTRLPKGSQDLVFENTQARRRTEILMNKGFVLGTGDLSELAQGWCTYNADHMSMYNVNTSIPKTLVNFLIGWVAENLTDGDLQKTLLSVIKAKISPELLPKGSDGEIAQDTEESIGPYELTDFFLYYLLRLGYPPEKIVYLACRAEGFNGSYTKKTIEKWLRVFLQRFFRNQFKRSCMPDGPKVGSICLSPRGDWRMPSDADESLWLSWSPSSSNDERQEPKDLSAVTPKKESSSKSSSPGQPNPGVNSMPRKRNCLKVLLRVDPNKCFMPGGTLAVPGGDEIVEALNAVSRCGYYDLVIDSSDEHEDDNISFACNHEGKAPGDVIETYGFEQRLWPKHGTAETGREFHEDLDCSMVSLKIRKGTDNRVDSYSAFYDNGRQASADMKAKYPFLGKSTGLAEFISEKASQGGYDEIQLDGAGLALGFCVSWSLIDARNQTYKGEPWKVRLLEDCTRAIVLQDGDYERHIAELQKHGIEIAHSSHVLTRLAAS